MNTLTLQAVLEMDVERREFLEGELYVPPSPETYHQDISGELYFAIKTHLREHNLGRVFYAPLDVLLSERITQPDIVFVSNDQAEIIQAKHIAGAPKWLIEIVSPTSHKRDFETKKHYYLENGVEEYWVVSLEGRVVWVFTTDDIDGQVYGRGKLSPRCLPDLSLELAKLFVLANSEIIDNFRAKRV
jgi:Uma2 family endonuclease